MTGLRVLWLHQNLIDKCEGLGHLAHLRILYLQSNRISSLRGLEDLTQLHTLNMSMNLLVSLQGIVFLQNLTNLDVSHNSLSSTRDIAELELLPNLTVLDMSSNRLDEEDVIALLVKLPLLAVLALRGNPLCNAMVQYRRKTITALRGLTSLDDLAVSDLDRRCAESFLLGGKEAEVEAREQYRRERKEREKRDREALRRTREQGRARRLAKEGKISRELEAFRYALVLVAVDSEQERKLRASGVDCSVCRQEFIEGSDAYRLPCTHLYHKPCILRWMTESKSCPLCRTELQPTAALSEEEREKIALDAIPQAQLVAAVRSSFFDFNSVALRMTELMVETREGRDLEVKLSAEGCRRRYEESVRRWRRVAGRKGK